ncbi:MAG: YjbH domain-containing protein [Rhizomicrobium sp.]
MTAPAQSDQTVPPLNFYGSPGLLDMPSARMSPDGSFNLWAARTRFTQRYGFGFQLTPWLESSFRDIGTINLFDAGHVFEGRTYYDRSFGLRIRLQNETNGWPAITVGADDLIGTGLEDGEYLVASKRLGDLDATLGMGWGRLAGTAMFENPFALVFSGFASRPTPTGVVSKSGLPDLSELVHGPNASLFGGVAWQTPVPGLTLLAEYSSDTYRIESQQHVFRPATQVNVGVSYQVTPSMQVGAAFMYGRTPMVRLAATLDPIHEPFDRRTGINPVAPVIRSDDQMLRIARKNLAVGEPQVEGFTSQQLVSLASWPEQRTDSAAAGKAREMAVRLAGAQGLEIDALAIRDTQVDVAFTNAHYRTEPEAYGRLARVLMATMPPEIETFRIVSLAGGIPTREIVLPRSSLERTISGEGGGSELLADVRTDETDVAPLQISPSLVRYPTYDWSVRPIYNQSLFDPNAPYLYQLLAGFAGDANVTPQIRFEGELQANIASDFGQLLPSDSQLPHVRSDQDLYYEHGRNGIAGLQGSYTTTLAPGVYALARGGILESMFAGAGGEILWRPDTERWALGATLYEVWQRGFDRLFDLQPYHVLTGHVSVYYQSPWYNLDFEVDAGRYLAGDAGATFTITRRFSSGVEIGAFATFTNVPFSQFGEGAFDKGFVIRIPTDFIVPLDSQSELDMNLRPVTRDGGQMLEPEQMLYDELRRTDYGELLDNADELVHP